MVEGLKIVASQITIFSSDLKHPPRFVCEKAISHYGRLRDHSLDVS